MITLQNNFFTSFFKASLLTALLMGGLVAQSYATTALFNGASMNVEVEFNSADDTLSQTQVVTAQVQDRLSTKNQIVVSKH